MLKKIKLENHPWQLSPCTPAKPTTTIKLMVASRVIKVVHWNDSAWVSEQHKLIYNDVKRKSSELGLMHSNAYKSFIKV